MSETLELKVGCRTPWRLTKWECTAMAVWAVVLLVISCRTLAAPHQRTLYPIWSSTSRLWWSGGELYKPYRPTTVPEGFRYSPTFAVLTTPFALFPDGVGGVLWRFLGIGGCAAAAVWWIRAVIPAQLSRDQIAILFLLLVPLSIQSVSNGQANLWVIALMLGAAAAVQTQRWNWASLFLALAVVCKLYPLAFGLLLVVLHPRQLGWRLPVAILALLALPFVTQRPEYVLDQYEKWLLCVKVDDRSNIAWDQTYRDLWLLVRTTGAPVTRATYEFFQVLSGAALAGLCWYRQRSGWPARECLNGTFALAAAWMLLLGPATESCTFILLAPSLAWSVIEMSLQDRWRWRHSLLLGSCLLFGVAVFFGAFPKAAQLHALGMHPLATLLYTLYLLTELRPVVSICPVSLNAIEENQASFQSHVGLAR